MVLVLLSSGTLTDGGRKVDSMSVSVGREVLVFDCGRTYFMVDQRLNRILTIARDLISSGSNVLYVSRFHPDLICERSDKEVQTIWLSERPGSKSVPPDQLSRLAQSIAAFVGKNPSPVVLIDGIEYLSLFNDFSRLQMFIEQVNDIVMESRAILLIAVDPRLFDPRSLAKLQRFAEVVS